MPEPARSRPGQRDLGQQPHRQRVDRPLDRLRQRRHRTRSRPEASTPVETVTIAAAAAQRAAVGLRRARRGRTNRAGSRACSARTSVRRRRSMKAPTPAGGCRFAPSSVLRCQSCRLSTSASAAAMIAPSQSAIVPAQGSSRIGRSASARLTSGPASAGATTASSRSQARSIRRLLRRRGRPAVDEQALAPRRVGVDQPVLRLRQRDQRIALGRMQPGRAVIEHGAAERRRVRWSRPARQSGRPPPAPSPSRRPRAAGGPPPARPRRRRRPAPRLPRTAGAVTAGAPPAIARRRAPATPSRSPAPAAAATR